jgi:hypothetical protein
VTLKRRSGILKEVNEIAVNFRKTAKSQISGRARLPPSRKAHNTRLSRSFALPLFAFLNDFAEVLCG